MRIILSIIILASIVILPAFPETTNEMQNTILENASLISSVKAFQDRYPDANPSINNTTGMISYQKEVPTKRPDVDSNPHVLLEVLIKNGTLQYIKLDCWDGNKSHVAVGNYNVETFLDAHICEQAISELNGISEETNIRPPRSDMPSRNDSSNYVMLESKSLSPLKQIKAGSGFAEIKCKDELKKIFKIKNNFPACVKPQSIEKLLQRGWLQKLSTVNLVVPRGDLFLQQPLRIEGLNETYSVGQKIEFTVKFDGIAYDCGYPQLRIENDNHDIIWESNGVVSLCDPDMKKIHIEKKWMINDSTHFGIPVIDKGCYYTLFVTFNDAIIQKNFVVRW